MTFDWLQFALEPGFWLAPGILFVYYFVVWLLKGRDPKFDSIVPRYEPPAGLSPAGARYLITTGSDGRSLAAVLARLAACGCVTITPDAIGYRITRAASSAGAEHQLAPEEAAVFKDLFDSATAVHISPSDANTNSRYVGEIQNGLRQLDGRYFTRNAEFLALGIGVTVIYLLLRAALSPSRETFRSFFLTGWVTFFFLMLGGIVLVNFIPMTRDLLRGTLPPRKFLSVFLGLLMIGGVGGIVIYSLAKSSSIEHAAAVVLLIFMNLAWVPALRALPWKVGKRGKNSKASGNFWQRWSRIRLTA